jgi:RecA/RadA recombinase
MSEELGAPRGYVSTRNIAIDRALGSAGIPLGRLTEVSGWEGAGKSTILDQILASVQRDGGLGVLADTERGRDRKYMAALGIRPESLVWIGGATVELMFDEIETIARNAASLNAIAWVEALRRAGVKVANLHTYKHEVYDPLTQKDKKRKPIATFVLAKWGRNQAASLLQYQMANGLPQSSIRDDASRLALKPCIIHDQIPDVDGEYRAATPEEKKAALAAWLGGAQHDAVQPADRPIIIGWDSVAGTPTEAEMAGDARAQHVASAAKVIRRNLRRLIQLIDNEKIGFVLVNQRYEKIQTGGFSYGPKSETYGGGGIKYHSTIRLEVEKVGSIHESSTAKTNKEPPIGQIVRVRVPKNKVNDPFHVEEYGLIFGRGADNAWAIYKDLLGRGIISLAGSWSKFSDPSILGANDKNFRGWMGLSNLMADDPALWEKLKAIYLEGR